MSDKSTPPDQAQTTAQVQPIIEAAEQAATGIIAEAEAMAKRYVEESREGTERLAVERARDMWALTDDLIARAEAVRRQSDELLKALNQTRRGAESALRAGQSQAPQAAPPPVRPISGGAEPVGPIKPVGARQAEPTDAAARQPSEGARLLAAQMAAAGSSRKEIANRLGDDFGIGDAEPMLDGLLDDG